ncbi:hypothetical protein J2M53_00210 [Arthrobacter sp. zg-ZUI100]|nr:hypothetical protein [Arthrobacter jiangjiafuii]MBP3034676.1 hypothetical protein [Arthrobacter jiangjiafuii]
MNSTVGEWVGHELDTRWPEGTDRVPPEAPSRPRRTRVERAGRFDVP